MQICDDGAVWHTEFKDEQPVDGRLVQAEYRHCTVKVPTAF